MIDDGNAKKFALADGCERLVLGWRSASELPDWREVGMIAAKKASGGYEYADARVTCPVCWSRFAIAPKREGEGLSPVRKMRKVDLRGAVVVEADCTDVSDALLDCEALALLELVGNVAIDEGDGLYATCRSCKALFPVSTRVEDWSATIRIADGEVEVEDELGRRIKFYRNGGFDFWSDPEEDYPSSQLRGMSTLNTAVLGVSAEARRYLDTLLGLAPGRPRVADGIDLLDVAVRNRFRRSYDSQFYQDVKDVVMMVDPRKGNNLEPGSELFKLPRDLEEDAIPTILEANQWPNTPVVRRAVKNRLALATLMAYDRAGMICGGDPDVVAELLGSFAAGVDFAYALHDECRIFSRGISDLFLAASREDGPRALVECLLKMGPDAIGRCQGEFRALRFGRIEAYAVYKTARREHTMAEILRSPSILEAYRTVPQGIEIRYSEWERSLASEHGGFRFSLPKTVGAIAAIGRDLGDEYWGCCSDHALYGEKLVVFVAARSDFVALVRLADGARTVEGVIARGGKKVRKGGRLGRAIGEWVDSHGLSSRCNRFDDDEW